MAKKNWTPQQFYDITIGKAIDIDGKYGCQCVDLWNYFNTNMNGVYISCTPSGYARSIYENRANNGVLKYFKDMGSNMNVVQRGDWIIWGKGSKSCPDSHVGMFWDYVDNSKSKILGQNQGGKMYVTVATLYDKGIIGILRPNQYVKPMKTIDEIAKEVIDGKWGNGVTRKKRLIDAGYDYAKVQAKVNELLAPKVSYYKKFNNTSIVDGLKSIGVDYSFNNRRKIANKNGIKVYVGTASQNKYLCDLARQGKLIKV